jgi:hypothetical protein
MGILDSSDVGSSLRAASDDLFAEQANNWNVERQSKENRLGWSRIERGGYAFRSRELLGYEQILSLADLSLLDSCKLWR